MLRLGGTSEALSRALPRSTKIADPARLLSVCEVAEVAHQNGHPAMLTFRVPDHLVELGALLFSLGDIGLAPLVVAPAHILGEVHHGAAMGPKLLQRFVEYLLIHSDLVLERRLFL